jgi:hypothetical protein
MNSRGSLGRTSATDPKPILLLKSLKDVRFMKKLARSLSRMRRNRTGDCSCKPR